MTFSIVTESKRDISAALYTYYGSVYTGHKDTKTNISTSTSC